MSCSSFHSRACKHLASKERRSHHKSVNLSPLQTFRGSVEDDRLSSALLLSLHVAWFHLGDDGHHGNDHHHLAKDDDVSLGHLLLLMYLPSWVLTDWTC
jgi:hypothetical protein